MDPTISSSEAKSAREALGLSQAKVALSININRAYLSQFENGRYILTSDDNEKLRIYYENEGYDFNDPADQESPINDTDSGLEAGEWIEEGFIISGFIDPNHAYELIEEHKLNQVKTAELCSYNLRENHTVCPWVINDPYIDGKAFDTKTREVLILMSRNYNIVEELQDREFCEPLNDFLNANSTGEFVGLEFGKLSN